MGWPSKGGWLAEGANCGQGLSPQLQRTTSGLGMCFAACLLCNNLSKYIHLELSKHLVLNSKNVIQNLKQDANRLQALLGSLSTEEQCCLEEGIPFLQVCARCGTWLFLDGSGINILLERIFWCSSVWKECMSCKQDVPWAQWCHTAIFSFRQHLPGSKPNCFWLYFSKERLHHSWKGTETPIYTYIIQLPTTNIAISVSWGGHKKGAGYSTAPK